MTETPMGGAVAEAGDRAKPQALALAVTSSTGIMSAAVGPVGAETPLAGATIETERRHAEELSPLIQKLLADAGIPLTALEVLIVDRGPGRFTGLRVGLATMKTLAFALDVPIVGLTSLEILAASPEASRDSGESPSMVTAVVDARRNEVFQQRFSLGHPVGEPMVGPVSELAGKAEGVLLGDGLDRYRSEYEAIVGPSTVIVADVGVDAGVMLLLAEGRPTTRAAQLQPLYLRDPDVNPNVKTRPRS